MGDSLPQDHVLSEDDYWEEASAVTDSVVRPTGWRRLRWPILIVCVLVGAAVIVSVKGTLHEGAGGQTSGYLSTPGLLSTVAPDQRLRGPHLQGELLDGSHFDSSAWVGHIVVINFWGSWCAPCRAETPELVRIATNPRWNDVNFIGVDVRDNRESARSFVNQYHVPYPSVFDDSNKTALSFRGLPPNAVPTTFVLDQQGRIAARALGRITGEQLTAVLTTLEQEPKNKSRPGS